MNNTPKGKTQRLEIRITPENKKKIERYASKCGLSTSEYVKQRALGFEPKAVPPDAFFHFCEKFDALVNMGISKEVEAEAFNLLAEISDILIKPRKEQLFGAPANRNTLCGEKEHPRIGEPFDTCGKSDRKECDATWQPPDSGQ